MTTRHLPHPPRWFWWETLGGTLAMWIAAAWSMWRARRLTHAWRKDRQP